MQNCLSLRVDRTAGPVSNRPSEVRVRVSLLCRRLLIDAQQELPRPVRAEIEKLAMSVATDGL